MDLPIPHKPLESDLAIATRAAKQLAHGKVVQVRNSYFKVIRIYAVACEKPAPGTPIVRIVQPPRSLADRAIGCRYCGKPSALVGDLLPEDELCCWCRGSISADAPAASALWLKESA